MHAYIYTRDPSKIFFSPLPRQPRTVGMPRRAAEAIAQAEQRIEDLKRENAQLREDLALSRRLEGFHWPWTRDRIKAQHLLPKSTE